MVPEKPQLKNQNEAVTHSFKDEHRWNAKDQSEHALHKAKDPEKKQIERKKLKAN